MQIALRSHIQWLCTLVKAIRISLLNIGVNLVVHTLGFNGLGDVMKLVGAVFVTNLMLT